jgi:type II secretory pathway pseudopilin PulG
MKNNKSQNNPGGFSVLEIMLAAGLFSVFSMAIVVAVLQGNGAGQTGVRAETARNWAIEGLEAVRSVRNRSFDDLQNTAGSGIRLENERWEFSGAEDGWEGFSRVVTIEAAQRDVDGKLVASEGTEDADLKLATVTVTKDNFSLEFSAYFSRREIVVTP